MDPASKLEMTPLSGIEDTNRTQAHSKINEDNTNIHNFIKTMAPSIGFFGCQFAWACQGGYVDPYLRQLGLADDMMNYAWILGPISGTNSVSVYILAQ